MYPARTLFNDINALLVLYRFESSLDLSLREHDEDIVALGQRLRKWPSRVTLSGNLHGRTLEVLRRVRGFSAFMAF